MTAGEGWFRALIDAAPDVHFRYDFVPARRFAYVSPAIRTATYTPDDFCRDPAFCVGLVAREDRHLLRQIVRARRSLTLALRLKTRVGAVVTLEIRTVPVVQGRQVSAEPVQQRLTALLYEVHDL